MWFISFPFVLVWKWTKQRDWTSNSIIYLLYNHNYNSNTKHTQMQNTGGLCCSDTNAFINFWLRFFDTRRETQFLPCWPYYADPTNARRILWCLRSLSVEIRKTQLHLSTAENSTLCPIGRNSTVCLHCPISTLNRLFFKILKFSGPSLPG